MSADLQKQGISLPKDKHQLLKEDCIWVGYVQSLTAPSIVLPDILTAGSAENQHVWHFMVSFCKAERNSPLYDAAELSLVHTYLKCLGTDRVKCLCPHLLGLSCQTSHVAEWRSNWNVWGICIILVMRRNKRPNLRNVFGRDSCSKMEFSTDASFFAS